MPPVEPPDPDDVPGDELEPFTPAPWERQVGEPDKAWDAFREYRDMGARDRSMSKVAQRLGKATRTVQKFSEQNNWRERVVAWDREIDTREMAEADERRKRANERHAAAGGLALGKALERLSGNPDRPDDEGGPVPAIDASDLDAHDVVSLLREGAKLERAALGLATDIQGTEMTRTVRRLATELVHLMLSRLPEEQHQDAVGEAEEICRRVLGRVR